MATFTLDSGVEMHLASPETFYLPPADARENLSPGDTVKLVFRIEHDGEVHVERMWVQLKAKTKDGYIGILDNDPYCTNEIQAGLSIEFQPEHVIQIYEE